MLVFEKWSLAVAHRRTHETEFVQGLTCPECGKAFGRRRNLQSHIRGVHEGLRKVARCDWSGCGRIFSSPGALRVHQAAVHEGRKPYECETCHKCFGHKHLLVRHRRTHQSAEQEQRSENVPTPQETDQEQRVNQVEDDLQAASLVEALIGGTRKDIVVLECPFLECRRVFHRDYDLRRHLCSAHSAQNTMTPTEA